VRGTLLEIPKVIGKIFGGLGYAFVYVSFIVCDVRAGVYSMRAVLHPSQQHDH